MSQTVSPAPATSSDDAVPDPSAEAVIAEQRRRRRRRHLRQLPTHAFLIALCLLWIYPFVWMVSVSFKGESPFGNPLQLIPADFTFDNYARAWDVGNFGQYFLNSLLVTIGTVVLVILISSLAGYALGRGHMPWKKTIVGVLVATMFLPHGYSIVPVFLLVDQLGLDNSLLGVVLALVGPAHIVAILLFMGYFASLPNELEEAALIDGAGHPRIYALIMLPLAKPVIATVAIFNTIGSWNAFLIPLIFTLTRPDLRTLGVGIYSFFGEEGNDWAALAAGAMITIVPIVVVFLFLQRFFIEGIAGAVKN